MDKLEEICQKKRQHIAHQKSQTPISELESIAAEKPAPLGFLTALKNAEGPALIAEVKKASPSKGIIRKDFDPLKIARIYQDSGATCLSVLTDEPYFQGHDDYLLQIKQHIKIPVLRKDFMIDPYQILESRALGADCILLIMAALSDSQARELYDSATALGMDVLVEIHDLPELERAKNLNPMMLGVNNRNLKTLNVDVQTSYDLMHHMPDNTYKISESGISENTTIRALQNAGYQGFLVGESLMRENDIGLAVKNLLN